MKNLKLVVFDCDGVMFDSKEANKKYYNQLLEHVNRPEMSSAEVEYVHSHNVIDSVDHIFRNYSDAISKIHEYRQKLDYMDFLKYMTMEPDLIEFLRFLKPNYHTAISTNRTTTLPTMLETFGLNPYFDKIVTAFDVTNPKPHPEALTVILDHFGLAVDETIFIGDSMVDREHTNGLGMRLIAFKNPDLPAEYHVNSYMEIIELPLFKD